MSKGKNEYLLFNAVILKLLGFGTGSCHNLPLPTVVSPNKVCGTFGAYHVKSCLVGDY